MLFIICLIKLNHSKIIIIFLKLLIQLLFKINRKN